MSANTRVSTSVNWDKVKEIVSNENNGVHESVRGMCNTYLELEKEGVFKAKTKEGTWWKVYEKEMRNRGLKWEDCYRHFPMLIKFLSDISKGNVGTESFECSDMMLYFEGILYEDCGSVGAKEADKTAESRTICMRSKRVKFVQLLFEMIGEAVIPTKGFQKMYALYGKRTRWKKCAFRMPRQSNERHNKW